MNQKGRKYVLLIGLILPLFGLSGCRKTSQVDLHIQQATNKEEVVAVLQKAAQSNQYDYRRSGGVFLNAMDDAVAATMESTSHSTTNVQVIGVDEGDIIKVDDNYIYTLSSQGFTITEASDGILNLVFQQTFDHYVPQEMYVVGNQLILIGGIYETFQYQGAVGDAAIEPGIDLYRFFGYQKTNIKVYQLGDRTNPSLEKEITLLGTYYTSRIIDDTFYFFSEYSFYRYFDEETPTIPTIQDSAVNQGEVQEMDATSIYYYPDMISSYYFLLGKFSLLQLEEQVNIKGYLGIQGTIYVSPDHVFLAAYDNSYSYVDFLSIHSYYYSSFTRISKISLTNLQLVATTRIEGNIHDRFSLDEYEGYLRIATTTSNWSNQTNTLYNNVFILDENLEQISLITNIAPGERIYSVRFQQEEGVLVTFRQVDPLFILDLSNPNAPTISTGLKEAGVNMYLHYIEGTPWMIGLGYATEETAGGGVIFQGIKVSLYDVSQAEAINLSTVILEGDWSYAEAIYQPKAILYDPAMGIFAFAAEEWDYEDAQHQQQYQGLYVFSYEDEDLSDYVCLSHFDEGLTYEDWYDYYDNYHRYVQRGARIGDYLYTISEQVIQSYSITTYALVDSLTIATFPSWRELYLTTN